jgi:tRNA threonylcarbamoyladenosine biosynthesis protein TsaE
MQVEAADESAMLRLGARMARALRPGTVVYLEGNLGMGKTTLSRGILREYGHEGAVKSPTYTLVEPYEFKGLSVFHFDLYRLGDPSELDYIGIRDYFDERSICLLEWPERGKGFLPREDILVRIVPQGGGRLLTLAATTSLGGQFIERLGGVKD